jgi:hypothetical protein
VQEALAAIEANEAPSKLAMLKLNLREAWGTLKMCVLELESSPMEGMGTALLEAKALVVEIQDAFNF